MHPGPDRHLPLSGTGLIEISAAVKRRFPRPGGHAWPGFFRESEEKPLEKFPWRLPPGLDVHLPDDPPPGRSPLAPRRPVLSPRRKRGGNACVPGCGAQAFSRRRRILDCGPVKETYSNSPKCDDRFVPFIHTIWEMMETIRKFKRNLYFLHNGGFPRMCFFATINVERDHAQAADRAGRLAAPRRRSTAMPVGNGRRDGGGPPGAFRF